MSYKIEMSPKAADDLKEIFEYIAFSLCEKKTASDMLNLLQKKHFFT